MCSGTLQTKAIIARWCNCHLCARPPVDDKQTRLVVEQKHIQFFGVNYVHNCSGSRAHYNNKLHL